MDNQLPKGYMGKVLYVDLTKRITETRPLDPKLARLYFGGRGLGAALLFQHFAELQKGGKYQNAFADVDPLSEDNVVVICSSPTTGTRMPTSGRMHMNYKSPLSDGYGSTNAGGKWSVDFKENGFDAMVITGRASSPVHLLLTSAGVAIEEAGALADLDAVEVRDAIRERHTRRAQVLSIGEGGKNLVRIAAVMSDTGKALGRGGGGAVWGSKNLYAIAVVSNPAFKIESAHPESFDPKNESGAMYHVKMKLDMGKFTKREDMFGVLASMGSLGILGMVNNYNQLVHNNMQDTNHRPEDVARINGEALRYHFQNAKSGEKRIKVKKSSCFNCPIVCKRETTLLDENNQVLEKGEGPEFESTTLLGADLSIYDLPTITQANYLSNRYGLDTISVGGTIASFLELSERVFAKSAGLTEGEKQFLEDVEDFIREYGEPGFGKKEMLVPIVHLIGQRKGIGEHLCQGSYRFCARYGHAELSMSVKKLELPAYDPRTSFSQALSYEMSNRGGCHLEGGYTAPHAYCAGYGEWPADRVEGTPLISKNATLKNTVLDIIGACAYSGFTLGLDEYAVLVNGVTGEEHSSGTLQDIALRTLAVERVFNYLCGLTDRDDWLPDRFYNESITTKDGVVICDRDKFQKMHFEYYCSVGWDDYGKPTMDTLNRLELTDLIPQYSYLVGARL